MATLIETVDLETTRQVLSTSYGSVRIRPRGRRHGMRLTQASLGPARFDHVRFTMSFEADADPLGTLVFGQLRSGYTHCASDGSQRSSRPGQLFLFAQPDHPCTAVIEDTEAELAVIDPALPDQVADTAPGRTKRPVRFTGYEPVSAQAAQAWTSTYAYIRDVVLTSPQASAEPLVATCAARLLAATALAAFPNNAVTDPTIEDRHDGSPATVRRAVTYIDEHASQNITIADVAANAHVTIRAVQLAFRRHLDTTPMAYLRRVRLDHAHNDLVAAAPDDKTVAAVAFRWGFTSSSRFAAYYRQAYGVHPSHTLRRLPGSPARIVSVSP
jgi:AraC-like DNA-binding protein